MSDLISGAVGFTLIFALISFVIVYVLLMLITRLSFNIKLISLSFLVTWILSILFYLIAGPYSEHIPGTFVYTAVAAYISISVIGKKSIKH